MGTETYHVLRSIIEKKHGAPAPACTRWLAARFPHAASGFAPHTASELPLLPRRLAATQQREQGLLLSHNVA